MARALWTEWKKSRQMELSILKKRVTKSRNSLAQQILIRFQNLHKKRSDLFVTFPMVSLKIIVSNILSKAFLGQSKYSFLRVLRPSRIVLIFADESKSEKWIF